MDKMNITTEFLPGSKKIYVEGSAPTIKVPMRSITLSKTKKYDGSIEDNGSLVVYDTSGPYSDENITIDLKRGLPKLRQTWIENRQDTEVLQKLSSIYANKRLSDKSLDKLRFEHVNTTPRRAKSTPVTQIYYAKKVLLRQKWNLYLLEKIN